MGREQISQDGVFRLSPHILQIMTMTEIIDSTVHAHHEVLARSRASLCGTPIETSPGETRRVVACSYVVLRYGCCGTAVSVGPAARGEETMAAVLRLLESSSSLWAWALPTLGSANRANSVNSKTTGVTNRMSDTWKHIYICIYVYIICIYQEPVPPALFLAHWPLSWSLARKGFSWRFCCVCQLGSSLGPL